MLSADKNNLISISGDEGIANQRLAQISKICQIPLSDPARSTDYLLYQSDQQLELRSLKDKAAGAVYADFIGGKAKHRRLQGGGKGQHIAKAIGLHKMKNPNVLDVTAGLGRDAFILANLGCQVTLLERSKIIHALLDDALQRVRQLGQDSLSAIVERMELRCVDSIDYLQLLNDKPDVIYIDPMFPARQKKALVKKEMRFFHDIAGKDTDSDELLSLARNKANKRIVVKRPRLADPLNNLKPNFVITGKSTRYDVYLPV